MTIHFHTKHFNQHNLSVLEYMMLMVYEQKSNMTAEVIAKLLNVSQRTVFRVRDALISRGYLEEDYPTKYKLTSKLYDNEKFDDHTITTRTPRMSFSTGKVSAPYHYSRTGNRKQQSKNRHSNRDGVPSPEEQSRV